MTFMFIILKILIVLICVLSSILMIILFIPFKYFMNGKIDNSIGGNAEVRWIFGLVKVIVYKYEDKSQIKIIICGLNIYSRKFIGEKNGNEASKKKRKKKEFKAKRNIGRNLLVEFLNYFKDIINIVKPKHFNISGVYGFEDPSLTGMLLGIISIIKGVVPKAKIDVNPDFEEETINLEVEIYGHIKVYQICYRSIKLIIKKEVRKLLFKKSKTVETF